ncbi:phosphotransferase family protein [Paracoccus sp. N5]|uniref:phosphotransferase family protein n=1 Tax=Paracoccus sp. N5 TaxID=1101189 RepID=UPI00036DA5A8|nr:phosphotransferase family protein [Paracoccus sp. N5]
MISAPGGNIAEVTAAVDRFALGDRPTEEFIAEMRRRFPVEPEVDALFTRKMRRRAGPAYQRITVDELNTCMVNMLTDLGIEEFTISGQRWFTGGVSKIQLGFTLEWRDDHGQVRKEDMVVRMDPSEGSNTTSRLREFELLQAFNGLVPVPRVFWLDRDARWFPEPALVYAYVRGVTKPSLTDSGRVSGMGTNFGPALRETLAEQFMQQLASIHTFDLGSRTFESMAVPRTGTTQSAEWQLNRALRIWEEDRCEDFALMDVAAGWLKRNLPPLDYVSVVHGDYRSGNFLFNEENGKISAWLDWERAHLGDRHRDLAWTTHRSFGHYTEDGRDYLICGLVPEDEFYDRYTAASGLSVDPDRLDFYRILNCFQIIASVTATATRVAKLGKSHQDVLLTRVKGMEPVTARELQRLLLEKI